MANPPANHIKTGERALIHTQSLSEKTSSQWTLNVHSGYKMIKRLMHTFMFVVFVSLVTYAFYLIQHTTYAWQYKPAEHFADSLSSQYRQLMQVALADKATERVNSLLNALIADPYVVDARLFDKNGLTIAPDKLPTTMLEYVAREDLAILTRVVALNVNEELVGYLRILVNQNALSAFPQSTQQQWQKVSLLLLLAGLIVGGYVTRLFYKLRARHFSNE